MLKNREEKNEERFTNNTKETNEKLDEMKQEIRLGAEKKVKLKKEDIPKLRMFSLYIQLKRQKKL